MKEYGGYIEFERYSGNEYYQDALALNCGRNCLAHLIETKSIEKIYLPYFLCNSVSKICDKYGVNVSFYHINENFQPIFDAPLEKNEYLYIVNFYGQLEKNYILDLKKKFERIILDNAQAFFEEPLDDIYTIYVPRKFFGVSDGAYLLNEQIGDKDYPIDLSHDRMLFLLGRFEVSASQYYELYKENNESFEGAAIKVMSHLTRNLLRGIDYEEVKKKREENFQYLYNGLKNYNLLNIQCVKGPFAYPLLVKDGFLLREQLKKHNIYIPTLWPNVLKECDHDSVEYIYAKNILPIPVDQRYTVEDMGYIAEEIRKLL